MLLQSEERDCGKCVVRNLLAKMNHDKGFYMVRLQSSCQNFLEMKEELIRHGIYYKSFHVDDIRSISSNMFPLICQVFEGKRLHFVIVETITKNRVYLKDPAFGEMSISLGEFLTFFTGNMMAFVSKGKKEKCARVSILRNREILFYCLCFLFQALSLSVLLIFTSSTNAFVFCVISAVALALGILLQNLFNIMTRHRLEKDLLLRSGGRLGFQKDYFHLYTLITDTVKCASDTLSYAVFCIGLTVMLVLNSYFFSFLLLVAFLFFLLRLPLQDERNALNRYCTLRESYFLEYSGEEKGIQAFLEMRKRSENLLTAHVVTYLLEIFSTAVFAFSIMTLTESFSMNSFLFIIMLTMSFSYSLDKTMKLFRYSEKKARELNSLSFSPFEVN